MKKVIVEEIPDLDQLIAAIDSTPVPGLLPGIRIHQAEIHWTAGPAERPRTKQQLNECATFDARGMHRVYGRGDHFQLRLKLDIWVDRDGRLWMRLWSRSRPSDTVSYELIGMQLPLHAAKKGGKLLDDEWVPQIVRDTYQDWVMELL